MSLTLMSRVFYTDFPVLRAHAGNGRKYAVSPSSANSVLLAMADNADDFGDHSYNSMETLALKTSLKLRSIPRIIRALQQNQYCTYKGVSIYGTSEYSLNLDKLSYPPKRRPKTGRPKSSDSDNKSSDSDNKSSDSESLEPSFNPPVNQEEEEGKRPEIFVTYETEIGPLTPSIADKLIEAESVHTSHWVCEALKIASANGKRNWNYANSILIRWKAEGYGSEYKPKDNGKSKKSAVPTPPAEDNFMAELKAKHEKADAIKRAEARV